MITAKCSEANNPILTDVTLVLWDIMLVIKICFSPHIISNQCFCNDVYVMNDLGFNMKGYVCIHHKYIMDIRIACSTAQMQHSLAWHFCLVFKRIPHFFSIFYARHSHKVLHKMRLMIITLQDKVILWICNDFIAGHVMLIQINNGSR